MVTNPATLAEESSQASWSLMSKPFIEMSKVERIQELSGNLKDGLGMLKSVDDQEFLDALKVIAARLEMEVSEIVAVEVGHVN